MLIILDSSLVDKITNDADIQLVVERIAQSRHSGHHIVFADEKTLKFLSQCADLSKNARGVYTNLLNGLSQLKSYLKCIDTHVRIVWEQGFLKREEQDNKNIILVSYTNLLDSFFEKTVLLAENLDDITVYAKIAEIYQHNNKLSHINLRYLPQGGGGQEIITAFQAIFDSQDKFCLCISDSDKKSPYDNYGSISNSLSRIMDSAESICYWIPLNVRAIENLFPISFYQDTFDSDRNKRDAIKFLKTINDSSFSNARKYLQMREGLTLFEIFERANKGQQNLHQYWFHVVDGIGYLNKFENCSSNIQCPKKKKKECECEIWTGFGKETLNNIIEKCIESKSNIQISENINEDLVLKDEWERIGKIILDWCCGSEARSTR